MLLPCFSCFQNKLNHLSTPNGWIFMASAVWGNSTKHRNYIGFPILKKLVKKKSFKEFHQLSQFSCFSAWNWGFRVQTKLVFWIFNIFQFWPLLGPFYPDFCPKLFQKRVKIEKYQTFKTQVLFVPQSPSFMQKSKKIEATGEELKFLKAHFPCFF